MSKTINKKFAVIDIETTGGKALSDKITEIAIIITDGEKILDSFESLINPEKNIPRFITGITGITNQMVQEAPRFFQVAKKIVELTNDCIFVAHHARFDYCFIQKEFKELGYNYQKQTLCTVKASRKLLPNHQSYSLGNLSSDLGIKIENRHRAMGDAKATFLLLKKLIKIEPHLNPDQIDQKIIKKFKLPPHLKEKDLQQLPKDYGVYYFLGKNKEILYIGKSKDISRRVFSHFSKKITHYKEIELLENIYEIDFEMMGDELISLLYESYLIKKHRPQFNRSRKKLKYPYGIYQEKNVDGFPILYLSSNHNQTTLPIIELGSKKSAQKTLEKITNDYLLHQQRDFSLKLTHQVEPIKQYQKKFSQLIKKYSYPLENFAIINKGRHLTEKSFVLIENHQYCGFGFFDETEKILPQNLKDYLFIKHSHRDDRQIILNYLHSSKAKKSSIIPL